MKYFIPLILFACLPLESYAFNSQVQWPVIVINQTNSNIQYQISNVITPNNALNYLGKNQNIIKKSSSQTEIATLNITTKAKTDSTNTMLINITNHKKGEELCSLVIVIKAVNYRSQIQDAVYNQPSTCSVTWDKKWYYASPTITGIVKGGPIKITVSAPAGDSQ